MHRTIQVGNRSYSTCLVAMPLHGDLGNVLENPLPVKSILSAAQEAKLISPRDGTGLAFLDTLLPRSSIQTMTFEDIYNLTPRLFDRAVLGQPVSVLDVKADSNEECDVSSAMLVGVLYWNPNKGMPKLLTQKPAQAELAEIVRRHVFFERADVYRPRPNIISQPLLPFLDATRSSSRLIMQRYIDRAIAATEEYPDAATLNVVGVEGDESTGEYNIEILLQYKGVLAGSFVGLYLDDLRDGQVNEVLAFLKDEMHKRGIAQCKISYQQVLLNPTNDSDEQVRTNFAIH